MPSAKMAVWSGLVFLVMSLGLGCDKPPVKVEPPPLETFPPLVAEMPTAPAPADEGIPGNWEPLAGMEPRARAFVVEPPGSGPVPGILLVHSAWGINKDVRMLARQLAGAGFLVVAPDLLDGVEAGTRLGVQELQKGISASRAQASLLAGLERLKSHPRSQDRPHGLLGLSASGVFAAAISRPENGFKVLVFDSAYFKDPELEGLARAGCPVRLLVGTENAVLTAAKVDSLKEKMSAQGVSFEAIVIPQAGTDLFDSQARGYNLSGREEALKQAKAVFEKALR